MIDSMELKKIKKYVKVFCVAKQRKLDYSEDEINRGEA